jgi:hypothetical protein
MGSGIHQCENLKGNQKETKRKTLFLEEALAPSRKFETGRETEREVVVKQQGNTVAHSRIQSNLSNPFSSSFNQSKWQLQLLI